MLTEIVAQHRHPGHRPHPHSLAFRDPWTVLQYVASNMSRIAVATSSAAHLPPALAMQYGIEVVPNYLDWDSRTYRDSIDISPDEVYQRLRSGEDLPTTAAPSPEDFVAVYRGWAGRQRALSRCICPRN